VDGEAERRRGLAVVAAALVGPRRGVAVAGIGFVALKAVPGAAVLAGPVLGGVTARDPSDLIALLVLPIVLFALDGPAPTLTASRVAGGAAVLPVLGASVALFATTATSCSPRPTVERLVERDGIVYAEVVDGWAESTWATTDDGGKSWTEADRAPTGVSQRDDTAYEDRPAGPDRACADDGTCFRLRNRRTIQATPPGGTPTDEFTLTDAQFAAISNECAGAQDGVLTSVAAPDGPSQPTAASLGAHGVVVRQPDGSWERVGVLGAHPPTAPPPAWVSVGGLLFGPVVAAGVWLFARNRWPAWRAAVGVALVGWACTVVLAGAVAFMTDPDAHLEVRAAIPIGFVATLVATVAVGRSQRFARRTRAPHLDWMPPPPDPPAGTASWSGRLTARRR
jgi:hypothetical protein